MLGCDTSAKVPRVLHLPLKAGASPVEAASHLGRSFIKTQVEGGASLTPSPVPHRETHENKQDTVHLESVYWKLSVPEDLDNSSR